MKTSLKNLFHLPALIAGLGLLMAGRMAAQTFTILHSFTALSNSAPYGNSDGANPRGLVLSGNTLYGTTTEGGSGGNGTIFKMNRDGTGFTNLHSFAAGSGSFPNITNEDGGYPIGLILSGDSLYGTTGVGGRFASGTVFALNTDGSGFTTLYTFTATSGSYINSDGDGPNSLVLSGNTLYGVATAGGSWGNGTVFTLNTNGTGFTTLYSFSAATYGFLSINNDGIEPYGLILSGKTLYGTAGNGGNSGDGNYGSFGNGTVFALNTDGTGFTTLHKFSASSTNSSGFYTNSDGASPNPLILSGKPLYGTTYYGGVSNCGTVFAVNTDGTGFTTLHSFTNGTDGGFPFAGLILSGNTLYGATGRGDGDGATVFAVNTDGTGFTTLYKVTPMSANPSGVYTNSDGAQLLAGLLLTNNTLYGAAFGGGNQGNGTIFSLSLGAINPPQLAFIPSRTNLVLTWPANVTGFTLQSTSNLGPSAVWGTNSSTPAIINGQNVITNPISYTQQFFRLSQ
jgi:uncharacterized repeat protein (TIGR03803 family)